nr:MAG TPA_asm: helix-turn-helix protein [Caudoviricetes sp.]
MNDINNRICQLINELKLTKTSFAKALNLSQPFVSQLCSGYSQPSDRTIWDICREFNVNETWLRTGDGEMFMDLDSDDEISAYVGKVLNDEKAVFQRKLLLFFSRLSPEFLEKLEEEAKRILGE